MGEKSRQRRYFRPTIVFDKAGFAEGFRFSLRRCFREQLAIEYKKGEWLQRSPAVFKFGPGATFYDHRDAHLLPWDEAYPKIRACVEVLHSREDSIAQEGVVPGAVRFRILKPSATLGRLAPETELTTTQAEFVEFLRTGVLPAAPQEG